LTYPLTWYTNGLLDSGLLLLSLGILTGNIALMSISIFPLLVFLLGSSTPAPSDLHLDRRLPNRPIYVGDEVEVEIDLSVGSGIGMVELHTEIPDVFELTRGSNLQVVLKRRGRLRQKLTFSFRCTRRGTYVLPPTTYESTQIFDLRPSFEGSLGDEQQIEVLPRVARVKRVRGLRRTTSRLFPEEDKARIGIETTDFRDIRTYHWGDSPRRINWKATARELLASSGGLPLVNEYEREGRKVIWVFLDCGRHMACGTNIENSFEYAIVAALSIVQFFVDRGYKVGVSTYNHSSAMIIYPELGQKQYLKALRSLRDLEPSASTMGLAAMSEKAKGFLVREKPVVFVVTSLNNSVSFALPEPWHFDFDDVTLASSAVSRLTSPRLPRTVEQLADLLQGLKSTRSAVSSRRPTRLRRPSVIVIDLVPFSLLSTTDTPDALLVARAYQRAFAKRVRRMGIAVAEWDPAETSFVSVLMRSGQVIESRS